MPSPVLRRKWAFPGSNTLPAPISIRTLPGGLNPGRIGLLELCEIGHVVAVIVTSVGDKEPLLEQELAAVDVAQEGPGFRPPGRVRIEMGAGKVLLPGNAHFRRRTGEGMPDQ